MPNLHFYVRICCGYGNVGTDVRGYDCLIIPGAQSQNGRDLDANEFCGASKGLVTMGSFTAQTPTALSGIFPNASICCKLKLKSVSGKFKLENFPQL